MNKLLQKPFSDLCDIGDVVDFDIAPVIIDHGNYFTTSLVKGKKYPATMYTQEILESIMKEHFTRMCPVFHGRAFDKIIDYYADNKWIEGNKDYYVIRGKIRLKR